jgi:hypothetical protein
VKPRDLKAQPFVPLVLAGAMLAVVLAATLAPLSVAVPADTNCEYGTCPAATNNLVPYEIALVVLILVAIILAALIILRRRRRPPTSGPIGAWSSGAPSGATGAAVEGAPAGPQAAGAGAAAAYLETPEDVGAPPPSIPAPTTGTPAEGAPEADIDSLMQELDKISNEILKRGSPKSPPSDSAESGDADSKS